MNDRNNDNMWGHWQERTNDINPNKRIIPNKSKHPERDTVITQNEISDLTIMLNTASFDEFLDKL